MLQLPNNIIDLQPFQELREADPKTMVLTLFKALGDMKVIACIVCFFMGIFFIGIDTVYTPMMKAIAIRDENINAERAAISQKEQQKRQFDQWAQDVASVSTRMVRLKPEQSAKVISLKESEKVVSIAKSNQSTLPDPHNKRDGVALAALESQALAIINGQISMPGDTQPAPAPAEGAPRGEGGIGEAQAAPNVTIEKYAYKLTLSGTYPAVMDFVNRLVALENLVAINEITIERIDKEGASLPDPEKFPDYPVKVVMSVIFSIYLYVPPGAAAGG